MGYRFNVPPNWPSPPAGWVSPSDWRPDPSWGPAPDDWTFWVWDDSAVPKKSHPVLMFVLLGAAVLFSIALSFSQSDKAMILEDPPSSTAEPLASIWVGAGLVLLALVIAALRPRPRVTRAVILGLAIPVVGVAIFSTLKVQDLSSSGFIDMAQAEQREAQALRRQAFTVCGGAVIEEASPLSEPYQLLVFDEKGQDLAPDAVDARGWTAQSLSDLQIVVCVGSEHESTRYCNYTGGFSLKHIYYVREVRVIAAQTGGSLGDTELSGGGIGDCSSSVTDQAPDEVGDHVDPDQVVEYIAGVLEDLPSTSGG